MTLQMLWESLLWQRRAHSPTDACTKVVGGVAETLWKHVRRFSVNLKLAHAG